MFDYKFVHDNGSITYICASSRKQAIKYFMELHGCSIAFVNDHCVIKCMGRVSREGWR